VLKKREVVCDRHILLVWELARWAGNTVTRKSTIEQGFSRTDTEEPDSLEVQMIKSSDALWSLNAAAVSSPVMIKCEAPSFIASSFLCSEWEMTVTSAPIAFALGLVVFGIDSRGKV